MDTGSDSLHVESSTLRRVSISTYVESKPNYLSAATKFNSNSNNYRFNVEVRQRVLQSASLSPQLLPITHKSSSAHLLLKLIEDSVLLRCRLLLSVEGRSRSPSEKDSEESPLAGGVQQSKESSNNAISRPTEAREQNVGTEEPRSQQTDRSVHPSRNLKEISTIDFDIESMSEHPAVGSAFREAMNIFCTEAMPRTEGMLNPTSGSSGLEDGNKSDHQILSASQQQLHKPASKTHSFIDIFANSIHAGRVFPTGLLLAFLRTELARGVDPTFFDLVESQIDRLDAPSVDQIAEALLPHLDWLQDTTSSERLVTGLISKKNQLLVHKFEQLNRTKPTQLFVKRTRRRVFLRYLNEVASPDQKKFLSLLIDRLLSNRSDLRYLLKRCESVWLLMATFCRWIRFGEIKSLKKMSQKIKAIVKSDRNIGASLWVAVSLECLNELLRMNYCRVLEILSNTENLYNAVSS